MEIITAVFNEALYRPLFNGLILLYNFIPGHDLGIAIIVLTALIRLVFYPLSQKAIQSQKAMNELQPALKEIREKHKGNKEEQAKLTMELYRKYRINPMAGCLPILIQLPILIALYRVFFTGLNSEHLDSLLYSFVERPASLNLMFLGIVDLSQRSVVLAVLAGIFQYVQAKMIAPKKTMAQSGLKGKGPDFSLLMSQQMTYFMPLITVFIAWRLPAALPLYWIVITVFGIIQQYFTPQAPVKLEAVKDKN